MGFLDRLFGTEPDRDVPPVPGRGSAAAARSDDEIALERYRYLLRTAPPETIEAVHREAYAALTEPQRRLLLTELAAAAPAGEAPRSSDPADLAQAATRAELRQPGTLERAYQGPGFLSMVGSSMLGTIAGYVVASALVSAFLPSSDAGTEAGADDSGDADAGSADAGADTGFGGDIGGGFGDFGDFGGDVGGFDF